MALKTIKMRKGRNWKPCHLALPWLAQQPSWHPPAIGGKGRRHRVMVGSCPFCSKGWRRSAITLCRVTNNSITRSPEGPLPSYDPPRPRRRSAPRTAPPAPRTAPQYSPRGPHPLHTPLKMRFQLVYLLTHMWERNGYFMPQILERLSQR